MDRRAQARKNFRTAAMAFGVVAGMVGFAFAMAPLYRLICAAIGFDGTPQVAAAPSPTTADVEMTIRFDANTDRELPWRFYPKDKSVSLKLGETRTIVYIAENISDQATTGISTFNVTPGKTGMYFNKIQCFCFELQTLQPGERVEMPVTFFVDPDLIASSNASDVRTITLSYTFFKSTDGQLPDKAFDDTTTEISMAPQNGASRIP